MYHRVQPLFDIASGHVIPQRVNAPRHLPPERSISYLKTSSFAVRFLRYRLI